MNKKRFCESNEWSWKKVGWGDWSMEIRLIREESSERKHCSANKTWFKRSVVNEWSNFPKKYLRWTLKNIWSQIHKLIKFKSSQIHRSSTNQ